MRPLWLVRLFTNIKQTSRVAVARIFIPTVYLGKYSTAEFVDEILNNFLIGNESG
jgi:hypothetical protein